MGQDAYRVYTGPRPSKKGRIAIKDKRNVTNNLSIGDVQNLLNPLSLMLSVSRISLSQCTIQQMIFPLATRVQVYNWFPNQTYPHLTLVWKLSMRGNINAGAAFSDGPRGQQRWDVPAVSGDHKQVWGPWQQKSLKGPALWHSSRSCFELQSPISSLVKWKLCCLPP